VKTGGILSFVWIPAWADTSKSISSSQFDLDIHTSCKVKLHQSIDRLRRWLHDIEQPFIGPHLELLTRLFVYVRPAVYGEFFYVRWQRYRSTDERTSSACGISDITSCLIKNPMVECLQADADILRFHVPVTNVKEPKINRPDFLTKKAGAAKKLAARITDPGSEAFLYYFVTLLTTPDPTVRPPSRIANRRPGSMAIGAINFTPMVTLSPGITISVPSGRITSPVTSVVRK
jgi:hypothetical protein